MKEESHVDPSSGVNRKRKLSESPEKEFKTETRGTEGENKVANVTRIKSETLESSGDTLEVS